jgi:hypothetical protein
MNREIVIEATRRPVRGRTPRESNPDTRRVWGAFGAHRGGDRLLGSTAIWRNYFESGKSPSSTISDSGRRPLGSRACKFSGKLDLSPSLPIAIAASTR